MPGARRPSLLERLGVRREPEVTLPLDIDDEYDFEYGWGDKRPVQESRLSLLLRYLCRLVIGLIVLALLFSIYLHIFDRPRSPAQYFYNQRVGAPILDYQNTQYNLATTTETSVAQMLTTIPNPPPHETFNDIGCKAGGKYLKGTRIPCTVHITDKKLEPTCWDDEEGVKVRFADNTILLALIEDYFPDLWQYVNPKRTDHASPKKVTWVQRADIWRYAEIYHYGGIYTDADACRYGEKHVDEWISEWVDQKHYNREKVDVVLGIEGMTPQKFCGWPFTPMQFNQWTFAAAPRSPVMFHILQQVHQQMLLDQPDIIASTGPRIFTRAILDFIANYSIEKKGFRSDGIPHAMSHATKNGKSRIVKCEFNGQEVNILIMGKQGMAGGASAYVGPLDEEDGTRVIQHMFQGSWKVGEAEGCDCRFSNCTPEWTAKFPIKESYIENTSFPLG